MSQYDLVCDHCKGAASWIRACPKCPNLMASCAAYGGVRGGRAWQCPACSGVSFGPSTAVAHERPPAATDCEPLNLVAYIKAASAEPGPELVPVQQ